MPPRRSTRSTSAKSAPAPSKPASIKKAPVKRGRRASTKKEQKQDEMHDDDDADEQQQQQDDEEEEHEEQVVDEAPTKRTRSHRTTREEREVASSPFNLKWSEHGSLLILSNDEISRGNTKIAAFDMDGTLIRTKSGRTFPVGRNDWVLLFPEVATKLKKLHADGYKIVIFTNQNGISTGTQPKAHITGKIQDLITHVNIPILAFVATTDDLYRKPAIDMWTHFAKNHNSGVTVDLAQSWYIGDAAGRAKSWDGNAKTKKDFSCGDRKFAHNIGLQFGTPEEFFLGHDAAPFSWGGIDPTAHVVTATTTTTTTTTSVEEKKSPSKTTSTSTNVATHTESKSAFEGDLNLGAGQEIVVFVGFPAAGKSTFARKWFVPKGYTHVNQDTLKTKDKCIRVTRDAVASGESVVVDNTNGDPATRAAYIDIAQNAGIPIRCFQFMTKLELAQHMNMFREKFAGIKHVPRIAYNTYKSRFVAPAKSEGFSEIKEIHFVAEFDDDKAKALFYQLS